VSGKERGAPRDMTLLAAAAALLVAERVPDLRSGIALAGEAIDSGHAQKKLAAWIDCSNS